MFVVVFLFSKIHSLQFQNHLQFLKEAHYTILLHRSLTSSGLLSQLGDYQYTIVSMRASEPRAPVLCRQRNLVEGFHCLVLIWCIQMIPTTKDGHVKALNSLILYDQYLIWELFGGYIYLLGLKSKVFCKKFNQILKTMDKGLTVPRLVLQFGRKYPECPYIFRPNLSAEAQKFKIFEKKLPLGVRG